jgi:hypothetical protein
MIYGKFLSSYRKIFRFKSMAYTLKTIPTQ